MGVVYSANSVELARDFVLLTLSHDRVSVESVDGVVSLDVVVPWTAHRIRWVTSSERFGGIPRSLCGQIDAPVIGDLSNVRVLHADDVPPSVPRCTLCERSFRALLRS